LLFSPFQVAGGDYMAGSICNFSEIMMAGVSSRVERRWTQLETALLLICRKLLLLGSWKISVFIFELKDIIGGNGGHNISPFFITKRYDDNIAQF
jgi:hypothetical protein